MNLEFVSIFISYFRIEQTHSNINHIFAFLLFFFQLFRYLHSNEITGNIPEEIGNSLQKK